LEGTLSAILCNIAIDKLKLEKNLDITKTTGIASFAISGGTRQSGDHRLFTYETLFTAGHANLIVHL